LDIDCSDRAVRPLILVKLADDGYGNLVPDLNTPSSFDENTDHMCVRWADPADLQSKWFCGQGNLADGVTGNVTINGTSSYRTWVLPKLVWGENTWDHHWEWAAGLSPVQKRIPAALQSGFAHDDAWNLTPRDYHADGRTKAADYVAGIVLKTTTWRSGVNVSPYNTRSVQNYMCNLNKLPTQSFTSANCPGI